MCPYRLVLGGSFTLLIKQVVIKSSSGFCSVHDAYVDKLTVTRDGISYEVKPEVESPHNPRRRWSYKTDSVSYGEWCNKVFGMVGEIVLMEDDLCICDAGSASYVVTYDDKSKRTKISDLPTWYHAELFQLIREMVPPWEICYMVESGDEE